MIRYKISFEYLGLDFSGSQIQKNAKTVQGELQKAVCTLTKTSKVIFAGRTDKNVSAKCQCAHFDVNNSISNKNKFLNSLNAVLPDSIRVFEIENVVASFHAQKSATFRHYQYKINNSPFKKSVFDKNVIHSPFAFDIDKMQTALDYIVGQHDFSCFKSVSNNPAKICTVYYAKITRDTEYILIDIVADRFLYNMVRAIVGTVFLIQQKKLPSCFMVEVLESKDRKNAGANLPGDGLTLIKTGYNSPAEYINKLNERQ